MKATDLLFITMTTILIGAATLSTFQVLSHTRPLVFSMLTQGGK